MDWCNERANDYGRNVKQLMLEDISKYVGRELRDFWFVRGTGTHVSREVHFILSSDVGKLVSALSLSVSTNLDSRQKLPWESLQGLARLELAWCLYVPYLNHLIWKSIEPIRNI